MTSMSRWCWLALLAGCKFTSPEPWSGDRSDGPSSPEPDTPPSTDSPSSLCFGQFVEVCLVALPVTPITVNNGETRPINTAVGSPDCAATTSDAGACVVAATSIAVNGTIRGTGARPLLLLATEEIRINGQGLIDVSSRRGDTGAGANWSGCQSGTPPTGFTGGWGGTNATRGGDGNQAGIGSDGGKAYATPLAQTTLHGGCRGGAGSGPGGGARGEGGGAVDLIAAALVVDGTVNASGSGAGGAGNGGGGGGGGAGGMIVLDAPEIMLNGSGVLLAQGGGGGEGSPSNGTSGAGAEPDPKMPCQAADGGHNVPTSGGNGGDGATTGNGGPGGDDSGGTLSDGGGGGGGGGGFVKKTCTANLPMMKVCPTFR
jgi:hypothetical protein